MGEDFHQRSLKSRLSSKLRLSSIKIENYKSLDLLEVHLPPPATSDEPDVFVLGSKNGVGKTSLLECCVLTLIRGVFPEFLEHGLRRPVGQSPYEMMIRAGASIASIDASFSFSDASHSAGLRLTAGGWKRVGDETLKKAAMAFQSREKLVDMEDFWESLLGLISEPMILPPILFFHSYRKVVEGSSELGAMVDTDSRRPRSEWSRYRASRPLSTFKLVLVRALMARSGLFEGVRTEGDNEILETLNGLVRDFAGGTVDKLRPGPDGTLELRVKPVDGGDSFSFDGLSSGQKEMIATLFLIWHGTHENPGVVLIDEPELHLNAEWQRIFIAKLVEIAPRNQYILATHAEEIWESVAKERRIMLQEG